MTIGTRTSRMRQRRFKAFRQLPAPPATLFMDELDGAVS